MAGPITPQQIAQFKLFGGSGPNPLFQPPAASSDSSQPAPAPNPPNSPPSAPPDPSLRSTAAPPPSPSPSPDSTNGAALLYGSPAAKPPMSAQDFAAANPDASKAYMPARPVGDFDTGKHPKLRHALASLFAGLAEFGGDLNHNPGASAPFINRWQGQADAQRAYDTNQPRLQAGALNEAYQNYLKQGGEQAQIQHTQAETHNLNANVPLLQHQQQFLDKVRGLKESGKYQSDEELFNSVLPEASTIPGLTRQMIVDQINNAHALGAQFNVQADKQGRPEYVQTRSGQKVYPDANGKFADPEMQKQWDSEMAAHSQSLGEEEGKEKRVAGYAAERQAAGFQQAQTMEGRKAAAPFLNDINDAKNQQDMMEKLTFGKMNPASQTAAMFKMIGLEQPTGTHRIMPAEIEGIEQMGGLSDRLKQKLLNWKQGDRFSPDLIPDVMATAKILTQNKVKTANDNLESTYRNTGYKVPGTDARGRLDKPEDYQQTGTGGGAAGVQHVPGGQAQGLPEGTTGKGSDGRKYVVKGGVWVPAQ